MLVTSILKKVGMALTGLGWFGFALMHLLGNLQIYLGAEAFNSYAVKLEGFGPLIWVADLFLVMLLLGHAITALRLVRENRAARPQAYEMRANAGESTLASRTMQYGGVLLLVFIVVHVVMFKFGHKHVDGQMRLYELLVTEFKKPYVVAFYVLAMLALGMHLSHGVQSALQSLGVLKPRWRAGMKRVGFALGWAIGLGFASLPIFVFFKK